MKAGREEGLQEGMKLLIRSMQRIDATQEQIVNALVEEYGLSREEAERKVRL